MKILDVPQTGSVAGVTSSRNRFGQYRRTRAIPVNPNTPAQQAQRAVFGQLSAEYRSMSSEEQAAWVALASQYPVQDPLGQTVFMTGHQMFISVNTNRITAGLALTKTPPLIPSSWFIDTVTAVTVGYNGTVLTYSVTFATVPSNQYVFLYASPPLSPGRKWSGDYRLIHVRAAAAGAAVSVKDAYAARFGNPPLGAVCKIRARLMDSGFLGSKLELQTTVEDLS